MIQALMKEFIEQREHQLNGGANSEEVNALLRTIRDEINGILDDNKKNKISILANMEVYRLYVESAKKHESNPEHVIRVCQAILAHTFGYTSRAVWVDDMKVVGLVDYENYYTKEEHFQRYKDITEVVNEIRI
jgi:hypothetical protein